jgi:hypothetical protein
MADILFQFEAIANMAGIVAPIRNMVTAMSTAQSAPSAIDRAATQNKWLFVVYVLLLLLTAAWTVILWKSGNRVQDELKRDADARFLEAKAEAARANERAESLERDNLTLRGKGRRT